MRLLMTSDKDGEHWTPEGKEWLAAVRRLQEREQARQARLRRWLIILASTGIGYGVGYGAVRLLAALGLI